MRVCCMGHACMDGKWGKMSEEKNSYEDSQNPAPSTDEGQVEAPGQAQPVEGQPQPEQAPAPPSQPESGPDAAAAQPSQTAPYGAPAQATAPNGAPSGAPAPATAPNGAPYGAPAPQPAQPVNDTTPLVLGILSIVFAGVVGLILGIIGLNKSNKVLKQVKSGKATGGKVTSIIGMVISVIGIVVIIAGVTTGFSIFGGPTKASDQAMESICKPSDSDRQQFLDSFESEFQQSVGVSASEMGLDTAKLGDWLFNDVSYTQNGVEVNNNTATVTYSVTSNDLETLLTTANDNIGSLSDEELAAASTDMTSAYHVIGNLINRSMDSTQPTTKTVEVHLTKSNGKWTVSDTELQTVMEQIYITS
jgi:hypothetical protein